ncbi:MAG: M55 family metallopeptidase [Actinopolymorphaceae bacterium]
MRVLISVDMEGIAGVVDSADVRPGEPEYERNRHLMTAEANAAVRGVLASSSGAEVLVSDAHALFRNLLPERLDRRARLLRGKPKPGGMLAGIESGVEVCLFVGYHGRAGTPVSVLAHTVSSAVIAEVRVDGTPLGEIGLNAALAAHHGAVPVLVSGDDTVAAEASAVVPGIRTVEVKRALGAHAADSLHPDDACARIEAAVPGALAARGSVTPPRYAAAVSLEVDVLTPAMAELALLVPGMERPAGTTVRYHAPDFPTAHRLVSLIAVLGRAG